MREINSVHCSCGSEAVEVETTDDEERAHGCRRRGCCAKAFVCQGCGTRWVLDLAAPDIE